MKSRIGQITSHAWLVNEISKQTEFFIPQPQLIKESIEKLITLDIIKRSEVNKSCYEYVA